MSTSARRARLLIGAIVVAVLIALMARQLDWERAATAARAADPRWLLLAVALNATILLATTARWILFLPGAARVPAPKMFEIVAVTTAVSNAGPMLTGQAAGIHLLATRGRLGHAAGLSVTMLDQLSEGIAKLALVAAAILLVPGFPRGVGFALLVLVPLAIAACVLLSRRPERIRAAAARSTGRTRAVLELLASVAEQFDALHRPARFALGVSLKLVQKGIEGLAVAAVAAALGIALPAWAVLAVVVAVNLSTLVAVTPGNLVGYEGAAFLAYRAAGVDAGAALALAVIQHAVYLLPLAGTGGLLEAARLWRAFRTGPAAAP